MSKQNVVIILIAVAGAGIFLFLNAEPGVEVEESEAQNQEIAITEEESYYVEYKFQGAIEKEANEVSFQYPCDWELDNSGEGSMSVVSVSSPDDTAKLQWPFVDMGLHDFKLTDEYDLEIDEENYPVKKYSNEEKVMEIVEAPISNEMGYGGFVIFYEDSESEKQLKALLSSMKFSKYLEI